MKDDKKIYSLSKEERVKLREKNFFMVRKSWFVGFQLMTDKDQVKMLLAMGAYFFEQKEPDFYGLHLQIAWAMIKEDLDEQLEHFYLTGEKIEEYYNNNFEKNESKIE